LNNLLNELFDQYLLLLQKPLIFNIEDSATIFDLKSNLESFVNIAVDQQVIQRMDRILNDFDELAKVVNLEIDGDKINGAAISLYTNNKFYCFLQFYNKNESDNQSNFFNQPANAKKLPIDTLPQYIEQLDSDESWHSSSSSSDSDSSDQSTDSSDAASHSKRKTVVKAVSPSKSISAAREHEKITVVKVAPQATVPLKDNVVEAVTLESTQAPRKNAIASSILPPTKSKPTASVDSTHSSVEKPSAPYIAMKPEQRKYALIINKDIAEEHPNFGQLMAHFYGLFESSQSCGQLNFSESLSITEHDDQLWVLCEDNETCEWIAQGARMLSSYKCSSFIKYFGLSKCRVVLPQVVDGKQLANIFQLLELQNSGLCTNKWCVAVRTLLDPQVEDYAAQATTTLCKNEILSLYVDQESKTFIQKNGFKLKYCFWRLSFLFE
ncbi:hypothetical protein KR093_011170, partial [Drosophila rubida]